MQISYRYSNHSSGFTLIELMIVVAIVAILSSVALPAYNEYVMRGRLVNGTNALSNVRSYMEQYYQDNRTYQDTGAFISPCSTNALSLVSTMKQTKALRETFTISCAIPNPNPGALTASYLITATGVAGSSTKDFKFTIDEKGNQATTGQYLAWGALPSNNACWITRKGMQC